MIEFLWGFVLPIICVVAFILGHRKLRPLFPVQVNCWFCNHDTKVPYGNQNCWDCPNCDQYNGFTNEGDYNKPVPAQYTEDINHPISCEPSEFLTRHQYLCQRCQRNQLLKVKQLANFEPLHEATYDEEMAFYKRHLESVYALCLSCDVIVKRELDRLDGTLNQQQDTSRESSPTDTNSFLNLENTAAVHKALCVMPSIVNLAVFSTTVCAVLLLGTCLCHCSPQSFRPWITAKSLDAFDDLTVCLCGLILCMLTKLLLGKHRVQVSDAVDILLWLAVLLVCLLLPDFWHTKLVSTFMLVGLELCLALKQRQASNITSPIMKRLSLDGSASCANSDAASEAVSSVSTSCRRRVSPFSGDDSRAVISSVNTSSPEKCSSSNKGGKFSEDPTPLAAQKGNMDDLGKNFGSFFIGPRSSESGYSSGRSSPFSFGMSAEPKLGSGVPFPRPLICPAKLSVVSFSPSSVSGTTTYMSKNQTASNGLFAGMQPSQGGTDGHANLFLAQECRPRSMFITKTAEGLSTSPNKNKYGPGSSGPLGLFSQLNDTKTSFLGRASSEIDFSPQKLKPTCTATAAWWRSSSSEIIDSRDDEWHRKDDDGALDNPKASDNVVSTECDSTTPQISKLRISVGPKKRKKKKLHKHPIKEFSSSLEVSDDEEDQLFKTNHSSGSTVLLSPKQGWTWVPWFGVTVVVISVCTNLFLAWTVWASVK